MTTSPTSAVVTSTETDLVCTLTHDAPTDLKIMITWTIDGTAMEPVDNGNNLVLTLTRTDAHVGVPVSNTVFFTKENTYLLLHTMLEV